MKTKNNNNRPRNRRRGVRAGTSIRKIQFSGTCGKNGTIAFSISMTKNCTVRVASVKVVVSSGAPTLASVAIRGVGNEDEKQSPLYMCTMTPKRIYQQQGRGVEAFTNTGTNTVHLGWVRNHGTVDLKYIADVVYTVYDLEVTVSRNQTSNTNITEQIYDGDCLIDYGVNDEE